MKKFLETVFYTTISSLQYLVLSCGHMTRSFLILVITVIWEDSITIFRVLTSHLFHSSMVWEQIFLSNGSLLRSLSAFCEYAVAVDLFGSCLQRQRIHTSKLPQPKFWKYCFETLHFLQPGYWIKSFPQILSVTPSEFRDNVIIF